MDHKCRQAQSSDRAEHKGMDDQARSRHGPNSSRLRFFCARTEPKYRCAQQDLDKVNLPPNALARRGFFCLTGRKPYRLAKMKGKSAKYSSREDLFGELRTLEQTLDARTELLASLTEGERAFVEHLLRVAPNFRYELSGRPKVYPRPEPGLESAVAAAKMMTASAKIWI